MPTIRELITDLKVRADARRVRAFEQSINRLKGAMAGAAAGAAALASSLKIGELVSGAEEVANLSSAFTELGGTVETLDKLRDKTRGLVSDDVLKRMANMSALFGISMEDVSQLAEIAVGASVATGESVEKMFDDILTATSRQSVMIADNLGILVKKGDANKRMAEKLGKSVNDLTAEEKSRAFTLALIEGGTRQATLASKLQHTQVAALRVATRNLTVTFSAFLLKALKPLIVLTTTRLIPALQAGVDALDNMDLSAARFKEILKGLPPPLKKVLAAASAIAALGMARTIGTLTIALTGLLTTLARFVAVGVVLKGALFALPLAFGAIFLVAQDLFALFNGGDSILGGFIDRFIDSKGPMGAFVRVLSDVRSEVLFFLLGFQRVIDLLQDERVGVFMSGMTAALKGAFSAVKAVFKGLASLVAPTLEIVAELFGELVEISKEWGEEIGKVLGDVGPQLEGFIAFVFEIAHDVLSVFKDLVPVVTEVAHEVSDLLLPAVESVGDALDDLGVSSEDIRATIKRAADILAIGFAFSLGFVVGLFESFKENVLEPIFDLIDTRSEEIAEKFKSLAEGAKDIAEEAGFSADKPLGPATKPLQTIGSFISGDASFLDAALAPSLGFADFIRGGEGEGPQTFGESLDELAKPAIWLKGLLGALGNEAALGVGATPGLGAAPTFGAPAPTGIGGSLASNVTFQGGVSVSIQGTTDMGPDAVAGAVKKGLDQSVKDMMRGASVA